MRATLLSILFFLFCLSISAQEEYSKATSDFLLTNGYITTSAEKVPSYGHIEVRDGKIQRIYTGEIPDLAVRNIDLDSAYVYPGFIMPFITVDNKLEEIDKSEVDKRNPAYKEIEVFPQRKLREVVNQPEFDDSYAQKNGIVLAHYFPSAGSIPGQSAWIETSDKYDFNKSILSEDDGLYFTMKGQRNAFPYRSIGFRALVRKMAQQAKEIETTTEDIGRVSEIIAFEPYANGEKTIFAKASGDKEFRSVLQLAKENNLKTLPTLVENLDDKLITKLDEKSLILISQDIDMDKLTEEKDTTLSKVGYSEKEIESLLERIEQSKQSTLKFPRRLSETDLKYAFSSKKKSHNLLETIYHYVEDGKLSTENALKSLTIYPAQQLPSSIDYNGTLRENHTAYMTILDTALHTENAQLRYLIIGDEVIEKEKKKSEKAAKLLSNHFEGEWEISFDYEGKPMKGNLTVNKKKKNYSGNVSVEALQIDRDIDEFEIDGNSFSFELTVSVGGLPTGVEISGEVISSDRFKGNVLSEDFNIELNGEKTQPE